MPTVGDEGVKPIPTTPTDGGVTPAGCSTCGGGLFGGDGGCAGCGGCGSGQCSPSRRSCDCCCSSDTCLGRFVNGLYQCVCCPDPCYDPQWLPIADAAFFVDAARPVTQMRLRVDQSWGMNGPDRAEYFWARIGKKGPSQPVNSIDVSELRFYTEAAAGRAGISFEMPYRRIEGDFQSSGFADITIGTKAMLLDCQLMQITFGFKTFIPSGSPSKGLSTGHVSLEPSLLWALRLAPTTYLQAQTSLWIPLGGDSDFQGNVFHYHLSLNQILWKPCNDLQLIGTLEYNGWAIINGDQTDVTAFAINSNNAGVNAGSHLASIGPGLRLFICDKIDVGIGSAFALTNNHWADEMIRIDFRWRF
jgi:hypothetical protein